MKSKLAKFTATVPKPKIKFSSNIKKERIAFSSKLTKSFQGAMFKTEKTISYWLDEAMEESTWTWSGSTIRSNGTTVSSPRNIVDTGKLKNSKKITTSFGVTQGKYAVRYDAPYANLVHFGGYIQPYGNSSASSVYVPGRPWITLVFREDMNDGDSDRFNFLEEVKEQVIQDMS